jgi:VanZ family protein
MNGPAHALRRAWIAVGAAGVALLVFLSLTPDPVVLVDAANFDKAQHAAAYAVLTLWFAQLDDASAPPRRIAWALVSLGVVLEIAQLGIDAREFSIADMLANAAGVAVGCALAPPRLPSVLARLGRAAGARDAVR